MFLPLFASRGSFYPNGLSNTGNDLPAWDLLLVKCELYSRIDIFLQSVLTLWKGIGSTLMVKGLAAASEAAIHEFTPLPKYVLFYY